MLHPANIALLPSNWRWSGWFTAEDYLKVCKASHAFANKIIQIKRAHLFLYASLVIILYLPQLVLWRPTLGSVALWKGCWKWKMPAQDSGGLSWHSAEGKGAVEQTIWSVFTRLSQLTDHRSLFSKNTDSKKHESKMRRYEQQHGSDEEGPDLVKSAE